MRGPLILGGLFLVLLVFGCAGKSYQAPAQAPGSTAIAVGDSDIAPQGERNESDTLSSEDVVPADNSTSSPSGSVTAGNGTALPDDSDLLVSNSTNEDLISQEDVVGPP